ncbi:MAG: hypothetical protein GWP91_17550 [Rhodobacterales bacterium]|nr:hypothetical protein [Rhodobacterales bacterium]
MNRLLLLVLLACNGGQQPELPARNIIQIAPDDAQILQVRETAVRMLPAFIERLTTPTTTQTYLGLNGRFEEDGHVEHLWSGRLKVLDDGFSGVVNREPVIGRDGHRRRNCCRQVSLIARKTFNAAAGFFVE